MTKRHLFFWVGVAALAAAIFIPMWVRPDTPPPKEASEPEYFPFVRSLEGTHPDGAARVAADDRLVVDAQLVQLFDYYLAAVGERPLNEIRQQIEQELDRRLKPAAALAARDVLGRYIEYRTALAALERNPQLAGNGLDAIRARMRAMQDMRTRYFSAAESKGMFGYSDAYDQDALARLEISRDSSLTEAQKRERLAALDAAMPAELRNAREAPLQIVRLQESADRMRAQGAGDDDVYRMRASALSPEAAARMAEVDREEAAWKSRIATYLAERSMLSDPAAIEDLRNRMFDPNEQKRLPAYEQ
ncbi:lipase secretion chaperone [Noviherbaspirillum massiliense]|uniref:lipase secretion chaperone n=1 Tax=Noviherbaspirillum massiliense TaxID=1465823 RepID=UPI00036D9237|nr:lipase secretion chaperone [Noviherbaspirillum massiliense]